MRIVVNDIAASKSGAMTILSEFYNYVCQNDKENEWFFLLSDSCFKQTENVKIIVRKDIKKSKIKKIIFDFICGKYFIQSLNPDVVLSLQNIITFGIKVPQCVYIHQSLPYIRTKKFSFFRREERESAIYQRIIGKVIDKSIKRADRVIVQTQWMKKAICKKLCVDASKIVPILPDFENLEKYKQEDIFDKKLFFYPTSDNVYKNNICITKACSFVTNVVKKDFSVLLTLSQENFNSNCDQVKYIGHLAKDKMIDYYNRCTLIFPSYVETVGLPLIEAKMLGTLILASDCPFSREVLNGYENAYFFDPFNPEELAKLMINVMDGKIRKKPIKNSFVSVEHVNSWRKIIEEVLFFESSIYH